MPTHTDTLAKIYARSLFELCEEAGGRDTIHEVAEELEQVCELARKDPQFRMFLNSPLLEPAARSESLKVILSDRITDLLLRFMLVLNDNKRLSHLQMIEAAFVQLVHEYCGRIEVDVTTAQPMDAATMDAITKQLHDVLGKEPVVHAHVDADLIGGVTLRIGDQLIDGSVATQLRKLEQELKHSGSHEIREHPERFLGESA
jgi:F-type H+-transporting ATPase subunit delta